MRIDQLTPDQTAALATTRDEWLAHGLATGPADRAEAEAGVADAYRAAGLETPRTVIWLDSPMAGSIAAWMLTTAQAQVRDQVGDQVGAQVRDQVWAQVRDQVGCESFNFGGWWHAAAPSCRVCVVSIHVWPVRGSDGPNAGIHLRKHRIPNR